MKKFLVLILFSICSAVYAEDEVYLDLSKQPSKHFDFGQFRYDNSSKDIDADDDISPSFSNMMRMFKEDLLPVKTEVTSDEKNSEQ